MDYPQPPALQISADSTRDTLGLTLDTLRNLFTASIIFRNATAATKRSTPISGKIMGHGDRPGSDGPLMFLQVPEPPETLR